MNARPAGYGPAVSTLPERFVTIGSHDPVTFLLRGYLETHTIDLHAPDKPHGRIGQVIRLRSGDPFCVFKGKHRGTLSKSRTAALRHEALAFYCSLVDLPGRLRPRSLPEPAPPGPGSKRLRICDEEVLFTPDREARSIALHTSERPARLLGEVTDADGDAASVWLTSVWLRWFGFADIGADVASAASHIWQAEHDAVARGGLR